jgi:hypothetical protein
LTDCINGNVPEDIRSYGVVITLDDDSQSVDEESLGMSAEIKRTLTPGCVSMYIMPCPQEDIDANIRGLILPWMDEVI